MISVVQRVERAVVTVEDPPYETGIDAGLAVLLGVEEGDDSNDATWMASKLAQLRIFRDEEGRMNRSILDTNGAMLVVSQFTLAGDCSRGNRPSFVHAAEPDIAQERYEQVVTLLRTEHGLPVETGLFGKMMKIELVNDGPVTIILRSDRD